MRDPVTTMTSPSSGSCGWFLREYARSAPQREAGQKIDGDAHSAGVARKTFAIHDFPFVL